MPLAFFGNLMGVDGLVILVVGLLIFGRRLPEVGKNLGKTIVEFKKGLSGGYSDEDKTPEPEDTNAKRLASGTRVSVSPPPDELGQPSRPVQRTPKRLPETEEV
jgi:sec-independent protein translocase protein TatA